MADTQGDAAGSPVDLVIEDARWEGVGIAALAAQAAAAALTGVRRDPTRHELALLACDDARIAELNAGFRDKAAATNVLSWPAFEGVPPMPGERPGEEDPLFIGDIAIAWETCVQEAEAAGIMLADHATHLIVHGVLHLLGYDHLEDAEAETMEIIETKALASLGIPDPYSR